MVPCAPRISSRLLEAIVRLDDERVPIAEVARRVGAEADRLALTRPSYQRIRELVHTSRRVRRRRPSTASVLVDVATRVRPAYDLAYLASGSAVPLKR